MRTSTLVTALAALTLSAPSIAGLNKCVAADGKVTYRQKRWPDQKSRHKKIALIPKPITAIRPRTICVGIARARGAPA